MRTTATDGALLILRIALGAIFIAHGGQKLFGWFGGHGLAETAQFLSSLGFKPVMFWAFLLAGSEFFGGILVILGLLTRLGALGILVGQIVAVATVHFKNGFFLHNQGFEYNLSLIAIALALVIAGAGRFSLDRVLRVLYSRPRRVRE